jgi:hypothetical protein
VRTGRVNGFLRVHCAAPSFAYYYRGVSSKPFIGLFGGAEKHKTYALSCAYIGQPVLSLVSSIALTHLKGKKNAY